MEVAHARRSLAGALAVMVTVLAKIGVRRSKGLWFALAISSILLLGAFWQWVVMDWITQFLFPAVQFVGVALLAGSLCASISRCLSQLRKGQRLDVGPLCVNLATIALLLFVPFTTLWLDANYYWHRSARIHVVDQIRAGVLKPNVLHNASLIKLDGSSTLSLGGNEVLVRDQPQGSYVLFFTFRGILDHYSGFLYVPAGGSPESFAEAQGDHFIEITPLEPDWFFVAAA